MPLIYCNQKSFNVKKKSSSSLEKKESKNKRWSGPYILENKNLYYLYITTKQADLN